MPRVTFANSRSCDELRAGGGDREGVRPFARIGSARGGQPLLGLRVGRVHALARGGGLELGALRRGGAGAGAAPSGTRPFRLLGEVVALALRLGAEVGDRVVERALLDLSAGDVRDDGVAAPAAARGRGYGGAGEQESGPGEHGAKVPERRGRQAAWHRSARAAGGADRQPLRERRDGRARRGGRARARVGRGGADAPDRAAGSRGGAGGGGVRRRRRRDRGLLRRRRLQRGRERRRRPTSRSASCPAAGRACSHARSGCRGSPSRRRARSRTRSSTGARGGSRSGASTAAASRSPPGSASTPSSSAGSTRSGARRTGTGRATSRSPARRRSSSLERRARFEPVLEVSGLGRAAFALVGNCDPFTYAGGMPLRVTPEARFELGLDLVAPRTVRPRDVPRLLAYLATGRAVASRRARRLRPRPRPDRGRLRPPAAAPGGRRGPRRRRARRARGRARGAPRARLTCTIPAWSR